MCSAVYDPYQALSTLNNVNDTAQCFGCSTQAVSGWVDICGTEAASTYELADLGTEPLICSVVYDLAVYDPHSDHCCTGRLDIGQLPLP